MADIGLPGTVIVAPDGEDAAQRAAHLIVRLGDRADAPDPRFDIALAGGSTPKRAYELLAGSTSRDHVDWSRWQVWFGDERACAPDDPSSNFNMATTALLGRVPVGAVHRMQGERPDLDAAAAEYSSLLAATVPPGLGGTPRLDLVLLGLGENGHTASLFPGTPALDVTDAWATRGLADYEPFDRITLTFPAINGARDVVFLVTGAAKGEALRGVIAGTVPAARVRPTAGTLTWIMDEAAARSI